MDWYEDLPTQCPPDDALAPNGFVGYRLLKSRVVSEEDFKGKDKTKRFANVDECLLKGVSLFEESSQAANIAKLPAHKNSGPIIAKVVLHDNHGLIKRTFEREGHYTWWRTKDFTITLAEVL